MVTGGFNRLANSSLNRIFDLSEGTFLDCTDDVASEIHISRQLEDESK